MHDVKDKLLAVLPKVKSGRVVMPCGATPKDCPIHRGGRLKAGRLWCQQSSRHPSSMNLLELAQILR